MRLRIFTEPQQGADYGRQLAVARAAEELGFDAFFRSDHYLKMGDVSGLPGPTDSWLTLAGLAVQTSRIRLGTLVSSATFRYPGPLAISVAQADEMSDGRVELGLGAGWFEAEHAAYGIPFPATGERFDRLEEQLAVITGLWDTPVGKRSRSTAATTRSPIRRGCPSRCSGRTRRSWSAGTGPGGRHGWPPGTRTSSTWGSPAWRRPAPQFGRVREACQAAGRDPASLGYSAAQVTCCGRDEAELARRAAAIGRDAGRAAGRRAGRLAGRDRGPDRPVRRARRQPDVPADPGPARPGPPGAAGHRGHAPGPRRRGAPPTGLTSEGARNERGSEEGSRRVKRPGGARKQSPLRNNPQWMGSLREDSRCAGELPNRPG